MSGMKCDNCGKGILYGHNVSHSKRRTQKIFKPNLHQARILLGSTYVNKRLCTKCLRMYKRLSAELAQKAVVPMESTPKVEAVAA